MGFVLTNKRFIIIDSGLICELSKIENTLIEYTAFGFKYFIIAYNKKIRVSIDGMNEEQLRCFDSFLKAYIKRFTIPKNNDNKSSTNKIKTIIPSSKVESKNNTVNNSCSASSNSSTLWKCKCGKENNSNFCTECGQPNPISNTWVCTKCGNKNDNNFCTECGQSKPASSTWICTKCGKENDSNFCTECGNKRNA
ncbi:zinc ribbon domain-containing protein [Oribacterium sp. P6A1]|uniref:zinc ribbon domain-containing protein n=1 Tax=Oribacterium sp. P6A1 TaxID=1410612 RepID=UPI0012DE0175|nr:zinc ribbon domain-containing protein [Oribacterium sp. P6A1]